MPGRSRIEIPPCRSWNRLGGGGAEYPSRDMDQCLVPLTAGGVNAENEMGASWTKLGVGDGEIVR